jgi:hypothetical protein
VLDIGHRQAIGCFPENILRRHPLPLVRMRERIDASGTGSIAGGFTALSACCLISGCKRAG